MSLTAILSARSKAACGLTNKPNDSIEDIDGVDVGNALAVTEYVDDIYNFYKLTERHSLTMNIVDRYLSMKVVPRKEFQLVGISAMLIARYEEIWAPEAAAATILVLQTPNNPCYPLT
ncbi:hypothetical protein COLO4_08724 [Corchorus olitorius]|uniref:Cyclin N-terminal domain-containing protein n=1 Tax=Corchorus olitorius TaxID=93759 RepID=A0A1R3KET7_9ROSI|nr:hypothetical protein COLO4_08724 [Corchorus olitorius]